MADKNAKFHKDFPLTQALIESVCDPKEYGDKKKYPFINYLPFTRPSKQFLEMFALYAPNAPQLPNPPSIKAFRSQFDALNLEKVGQLRDKSKCKVKELFIKNKNTNNIIHAYTVQYENASINNGVIIDCHGGGYVLWSCRIHFCFAELLSKLTKCVIILLNYKLAPEYPLPNAVDELVLLYQYVLNQYEGGISSTKIAIIGDSAGGGMVLLGLQAIKYGKHSLLKLPQPSCVWLNSPWCNITTDGLDKYEDNALYVEDSVLWVELMSNWAVGNNDGDCKVIGYNDKRNEIYSPQFGKFHGLAPMYFTFGASEMAALDNAVQTAKKAFGCDVEVQFDIAPYMPHVWPIWIYYAHDAYPEALEACNKGIKWILSHFNNTTNISITSKL